MKRKVTLAERLFSKCNPQLENGCIEWKMSLINSGYGAMRIGAGRRVLAHRAAWIIKYGEIPDGMFVLHNCDNKRCVNVEHLRIGTQKDNMRDAMERGQHPFANGNPKWIKLNANDLPKVFKLRAEGWTQQRIADSFGVSRPLISLLLSGKLQRTNRSLENLGECHF